MVSEQTMVLTVIGTIFASGGFWAFLTYMIQRRDIQTSAISQMLKGLGHDRICYLGAKYVEQGYITKADYENLHDYLFKPYQKLGGNGTAEKMMREVDKLPLREDCHDE